MLLREVSSSCFEVISFVLSWYEAMNEWSSAYPASYKLIAVWKNAK